jgi:hypothetical protein
MIVRQRKAGIDNRGIRQHTAQPAAPQLHLHRDPARHAAGRTGSDHRGHRTTDRGRRPGRGRTPVLGGDQLSARVHHRDRDRREARRPVRPQGGIPGGHRLLSGRLGAVRALGIDDDAGVVPRTAGHRRRGHHGDRHRGDRRGDPVAGPWALPGCARCGVRGDHRGGSAAWRLLHRPPDLAMGVLDQCAGVDRGVGRGGSRDPDPGEQGQTRHRLHGQSRWLGSVLPARRWPPVGAAARTRGRRR